MKNILIICLFIISSSFARVIVISDIDDTIKKSNSMGGASQIYHFFKMKSYPVMSSIYKDIKNHYGEDNITFYYVSAAPDYIYDQDRWLEKKGFPKGESFLRKSLVDETYKYKMRTIRKLLTEIDVEDTVYFFGDNSSHDPKVYQDIVKELALENTEIFIRDVSTLETFDLSKKYYKDNQGTLYFFSERDLVGQGLHIGHSTLKYIEESVLKENLVPLYTLNTLKKRMRKLDLCSLQCDYASELFFSYY